MCFVYLLQAGEHAFFTSFSHLLEHACTFQSHLMFIISRLPDSCLLSRVFSAPSPPPTALRRHSGHSCSCPLNQFMSTLSASSLSLPRSPHFSSVRSVSVHLGHCGRFFPVPSPTSPCLPSVQMWTNVTAAVAASSRRLPAWRGQGIQVP